MKSTGKRDESIVTAEFREVFAARLREAGLDTTRFIDVLDGEKGSHDHTQYPPDDPHLSGNYGVYAGEGAGDGGGGYLVDVDIDDYTDGGDSAALDAVRSLPETLTVASPHTDGETGGHRYYAVDDGDMAAKVEALTGVENPGPSWGELRIHNQYVVGPGSQLDGCDKEWCDDCATPDGGRYTIATDAPVATILTEDLLDVLRADGYDAKENTTEKAPTAPARDVDVAGERPEDDEISERLEAAFANAGDGERIRNVYNGNYAAARFDDRSAAEFWLANRLDSWVGLGDDGVVERLMDRANLQKWPDRTDRSYRDSVLANVGDQDWYNEPEPAHETVAVLPDSPRLRNVTSGLSWQVDIDGDGDDGPTISREAHYRRVREALDDAMRRQDRAVIDAIMGGGKTFNTFAAARDRGERLAYFAPRVDLYEQAVEYATENGYDRGAVYILPSIKRDCPTFRGEHGEEWERRIKGLYRLGMLPKTIHTLLGDELPCRADGKCQYEHRCDFDPDDYDVLVGHYKHAHLPHVTKGRHAVFDEEPSDAFTTTLEGRTLIRGVNAFLALADSPPAETFTDLLDARRDPERRRDALAWFDGFDFEPDQQNVLRFETEGFHAYAPHAVYTILAAEPLDDGYPFERASLPGLDNTGLFFVTDDEHAEFFVEVQTPPELTYARAVIALDGTPLVDESRDDPHRPREWCTALGRPLNHRQILTDAERAEFLRDTQGHVYIQTSPHVKPYSSGTYADPVGDAALLRAVTEVYGNGTPPLVFTSKKVGEQYKTAGFVEQGLAAAFDHPQNIRGTDEYADTRLLVQLGSTHHGDHALRRRAARLGETIAPEGKGNERDYGTPIGNALLRQMREAQTAQNALRVGRDGNGALVVLHTSAIPEWLPIEDAPASVDPWRPGDRDVSEAFAGLDATTRRMGVRTDEVASLPGVDFTEGYVRAVLRRHADRGLVERRRDPDDGRRVVWVDTGVGDLDVNDAAEVDLPELDWQAIDDGGVTDISRITLYTRNIRNRRANGRGDGTGRASVGAEPDEVLANGGEPAPDGHG